jgi:N6-L-threonylcarbamoyladenine synthase
LSKKIKSKKDKQNLAASFQFTINEILKKKTKIAMLEFLKEKNKNKKYVFVIAGGVAANKTIRENLKNTSKQMNFTPIFPELELCTDNAAMIAWAGIEKYKTGEKNNLKFKTKPRWPLDESAPFLKGPGVQL